MMSDHKCGCPANDAWKCAVQTNRTTVSCHCYCHQERTQKRVSVIWAHLPMPPQSNNCYVTSRSGHRFPSRELKEFKVAMENWRLEHLPLVTRTKAALIADLPEFQRFLRVDRYFVFPRGDIFAKNGRPKRMDASNRIKCLDDCVSEILGLDDQWFWSGSAEKVEGHARESVIVVSTINQPRSLAAIERLDGEFKYPAMVRATLAAEDAFQ
jgi:hypothetical protein